MRELGMNSKKRKIGRIYKYFVVFLIAACQIRVRPL